MTKLITSSIEISNIYRCGYIAIIGRPNVGKSTLMNMLIGTKISITSHKPQTTRGCITGIQTKDTTQFIYLDTPGFQIQDNGILHQNSLNRIAISMLGAADVILFVIQAGIFKLADEKILALLPTNIPCILVMNKFDYINDKTILVSVAQNLISRYCFAVSIFISAKQRFQLHSLQNEIQRFLPYRPLIFDKNDVTNCNEKFLAAEIIREKIFRMINQEIPYTSIVCIEKFEQNNDYRRIFSTILVKRESHKSIIIGQQGKRLKEISTQARLDMKKLFGGNIYLEIWIKLKS